MKRFIAYTLTGFLFAAFGMGMAITAQAEIGSVIKVKIPFEFAFGDQSFPPGNYSLTQASQHVLTLRDERGRALGSALTESAGSLTPKASQVRFTVIAGRYFLSEVWQDQAAFGERLSSTRARKLWIERASTESGAQATAGQP